MPDEQPRPDVENLKQIRTTQFIEQVKNVGGRTDAVRRLIGGYLDDIEFLEAADEALPN